MCWHNNVLGKYFRRPLGEQRNLNETKERLLEEEEINMFREKEKVLVVSDR